MALCIYGVLVLVFLFVCLLLVTNNLSFLLIWKYLFPFYLWRKASSDTEFLAFRSFINILNMSFLQLVASIDSDKSAVTLSLFPCMWFAVYFLAVFKFFSLSLAIRSLTLIYLARCGCLCIYPACVYCIF